MSSRDELHDEAMSLLQWTGCLEGAPSSAVLEDKVDVSVQQPGMSTQELEALVQGLACYCTDPDRTVVRLKHQPRHQTKCRLPAAMNRLSDKSTEGCKIH